ncbi:MAG: 4-alpha-glucanotransferase [Opitutales bacterium]
MAHDALYNWLDTRGTGVLLHMSSLPSDTGIGNLGPGAYRYIDFLAACGMRIWQLCPLGPTGYGDSPYQSFSAFAGNPYFIDPDPLLEAGLFEESELRPLRNLPSDHVDYGTLYSTFWPNLYTAFERFRDSGNDTLADFGSLREFRRKNAFWIEDFAWFMALKNEFEGASWSDWPKKFRDREQARQQPASKELEQNAEAHVFYQYVFFGQLRKLRRYAADQGVEIMGDVPIFVALDSADVWARPELFQLKKDGKPKAVAGVPPDYFAADGQLWGNPLFDWKAHKAENFAWWIERIRSNLGFYDIVRLDHFRGFESYWSVPANETTARNGRWVKSPGLELFTALRSACPNAKLVAEDLGVITDAVTALREATGLPGMAVLHFAFGGDADNPYLPHNYDKNLVVYSGTHDNDTTWGLYASLDEETKDHIRRYLAVSGEDIAWDLFRAAIRSSAYMAIVTLQDLLNLGSEARLNRPGSPEGNWQWRYKPEQLDELERDKSGYIRELLGLYGRWSLAGSQGSDP